MRRLTRAVRVAASLAMILGSARAPALSAPPDDLARGIQQVEGGEFDAAAITLDAVVRRLSAQPSPPAELARAYLYLAIAYLGMSQEQAAKARFLDALKADRSLELSTGEFPPRIVDFFQQVKRESAAAAPVTPAPTGPAPTPAPTPTPAAPAPVRPAAPAAGEKKGGSGALLVVGGGAAAALVAALALGGGDDDDDDRPTTTTTTTTTTLPPFADLRVNGEKSGTQSCSAPLIFTVGVVNRTAVELRIDSFALNFTVLGGACTSHQAPVDGTAFSPRAIPAGASAEIRRFDLLGTLCSRPLGRMQCTWRSTLQVSTGAGALADTIEFNTR
ncbi:MAG TPA: hypothetical protein VMT87_00370 [Vicinamibacteria bacterium]|nr:hypothetical protein [Vicinamibacteria bacterium]